MNPSPRISVVMPSFNQGQYLNDAIESVLSQGQHLHELLVLDGGSTDGSVGVICKHAERIAFWRSEPDEGQSAALREGFDRATGEVLCWLNSDDLFLPRTFDCVAETFAAKPDAEVVSGFLYYIDAHGAIIECPQVLTGSHRLARLGVVNVNQQATFFKKDLYDRMGGIDATLYGGMDMDLWCRFHSASARWIPIPHYLAAFRMHSATKGWRMDRCNRYHQEKALVRSRYPHLYGSQMRQKLGLVCYRMAQIASGRHVRGIQQTRRLAGKPLTEVVGP